MLSARTTDDSNVNIGADIDLRLTVAEFLETTQHARTSMREKVQVFYLRLRHTINLTDRMQCVDAAKSLRLSSKRRISLERFIERSRVGGSVDRLCHFA